MTLGSLFDGSGTCPLAATMRGITPVWASEIEPYPIRVTKKNFPEMLHLGDITAINGAEIELVDIVAFGSPCQGLSVAGEQKGIFDDDRSNLFFEAIRVIKEMREATHGEYPRYVIWENVPGAFSSNQGRDFLEVLRAFVRAAGGNGADVPAPARGGKSDKLVWRHAGCIMGDGFSVAWRVLDAQYWGVPQRRKRIFLVCDFGGGRAAEILFKREGLRGNFAQSRAARKETAADAVGSTDRDYREVYALQGNGIDRADTAGCNGKGWREDVSSTLHTVERLAVVYRSPKRGEYVASEVGSTLLAHLSVEPRDIVVYDARGNGDGQIVPTITGDHENRITDYTAVTIEKLRRYIVRRLTPLECCRLQGFPDWWEDGVAGNDSARYKMWGNGMALPCVLYVMEGLADELNNLPST